jgi:hypothetical protein
MPLNIGRRKIDQEGKSARVLRQSLFNCSDDLEPAQSPV